MTYQIQSALILEKIRALRKEKKISQESIAFDLGIDYSTYGKIERGAISLTVERCLKICELLGISIKDLL